MFSSRCSVSSLHGLACALAPMGEGGVLFRGLPSSTVANTDYPPSRTHCNPIDRTFLASSLLISFSFLPSDQPDCIFANWPKQVHERKGSDSSRDE